MTEPLNPKPWPIWDAEIDVAVKLTLRLPADTADKAHLQIYAVVESMLNHLKKHGCVKRMDFPSFPPFAVVSLMPPKDEVGGEK